VTAGVTLEVHVKEYLDDLAVAEQRDRSFTINRIVREYARSKGIEIPSSEVRTPKRVRASQ
jgi:hypothetical protein